MKYIVFFVLLSFTFCSCAVFDFPKRFAGISRQKFDHKTKGRFSRDFDLTKKEAFDKSLAAIKRLRARVTSKSFKKGYIVAFDFAKSFDYCLDSTEAEFLIEEINASQVRISVISNNSLLAKNLSEKYFTMMAEPAAAEK